MKLKNPQPPNKFYYKFYFFVGLVKHPKRLLNYIIYRCNKNKINTNYMPLYMDIEPTQRCNFKCKMCVNASFSKKRKDMTFEEFKKIIDFQNGLIEIKIVGVGEPLLNKDFFKMLDYARKKHLWVRSNINGSLLHINDNYKKLIDTKLHDFNISIDGMTKEVYESIRIGADFDRLIENCKIVNDYNKKKNNKTIIRAWVVVQKENVHQLYEFPAFFKRLGFHEVTFSFAMHNYGRRGKNNESVDFALNGEIYNKLTKECNREKIKLSFFFHPKDRIKKTKFCFIPFNKIYVTTDSYMLPCCYIANQEIINFGKHEDFSKIWFGKYINFRKVLKNNDHVPTYCKQCYRDEK